jgi:serine/threonine protein kinase
LPCFSRTGHLHLAKRRQADNTVLIKERNFFDEYVVAEILALKEAEHPNVIAFLGSHLGDNEVWIVMEHLKGEVSLTDILENSALEEESQISKICFEVRRNLLKELCCVYGLYCTDLLGPGPPAQSELYPP